MRVLVQLFFAFNESGYEQVDVKGACCTAREYEQAVVNFKLVFEFVAADVNTTRRTPN